MEGAYSVVACNLSIGWNKIITQALIHYSATVIAFVDKAFIRHHNFPLHALQKPRVLKVIETG